ncbi:CPBP family intramembrane glutamic endopeptidase [Lactobacillus psittaci]|uniref:Caax amino protease n=1 Tax=Lactobacillus psittaci DSM 15354 TaxID=1122152 RepID=A0A0R1S2G3_9LACO|nr:CPBP family intramembrane glutamic endopeptidase [Lactobacillus psittaci]KRL63325.1 Caax amino protease [Lactobacillus psittaci DSM 15354]
MKKDTIKVVFINWGIVMASFTILAIGLMLIEEFLIEAHILPISYSWLLVLLRYVLAVYLLWIFNQKIVQVKLNFKFKLNKVSLPPYLIAVIYVVYNLTGAQIKLKTNDQITTFLFCLGPGIFEEIWFRGIIFKKLRKISHNNKLVMPILLSSFLFAAVHLLVPDYLDIGALTIQAVTAFVNGILFAVVYLVSNNLVLPIAMHFSANVLSFFGAGNPFLPKEISDWLFYQLNNWQYALLEVVVKLSLALLIWGLYYFEKRRKKELTY